MKDILNKEQEILLVEALNRCLNDGNYLLHVDNKVTVRIVGVQDKEVFVAIACRIFKKEKLDEA